MIHLVKGEEQTDLVIFCKDPDTERGTDEYKDYKEDGYKEVGTFSLSLVEGDENLPYSVENI